MKPKSLGSYNPTGDQRCDGGVMRVRKWKIRIKFTPHGDAVDQETGR